MDDVVGMAVLERTANLPCKLSGTALSESTMGNNVVEHLAAVDPLADHVIVVRIHMHRLHAADIGMMEQHLNRCFADRAHFFREVLLTGLGHFLRRWTGVFRTGSLGGLGGHGTTAFLVVSLCSGGLKLLVSLVSSGLLSSMLFDGSHRGEAGNDFDSSLSSQDRGKHSSLKKTNKSSRAAAHLFA